LQEGRVRIDYVARIQKAVGEYDGLGGKCLDVLQCLDRVLQAQRPSLEVEVDDAPPRGI